MRLPVVLVLICGIIVCVYLFGLLIDFQYREVPTVPAPIPQSQRRVSETSPLIHPNDGGQPDNDSSSDSDKIDGRITANWTAITEILRQKITCDNRVLRARTYQRGTFWVLENYVAAERRHVHCYESVTYTTHTDYTFLDNLVPVVERWRAPVSVAIYAPGDDLKSAKESIFYMRNCLDNQRHMELIRELVSFHLYFNSSHLPTDKIQYDYNENDLFRCTTNPMLKDTYKAKNNLFYPVNVGRNVARDAAATYFILPSDIELYPSLNIVPRFLQMIAKEPGGSVKKRRVYPLAIYETAADAKVPKSKTELMRMLRDGQAVRFHAKICNTCHSVPDGDQWESTPENIEMRIFAESKRRGKFHHWEPIYIGTQEDPYYDERLSWEGKSDKMTQGYILCLLDYTFALLSDAFLTHRPGFKTIAEARRSVLEAATVKLIREVIGPEIQAVYGSREGCKLN